MGGEWYYYFGVYIRAMTQIKEESIIDFKRCLCSPIKYSAEPKYKYCHKCGQTLDEITTLKVTGLVNPYDVIERVNEAFFSVRNEELENEGIHIYISNYITKGGFYIENKAQIISFKELELEELAISRFEQQFKEALKILKELYEHVELDFGLLVYWN